MNELLSIYNTFQRRIDGIELFVQNMMSNNETWESFEEFKLSKKQREALESIQSPLSKTIQYNAIIISLYGCFEKYIDSIFSRYLDIVFLGIEDYDKLPSKLKDKYKTKLGEYLTAPHRFNGIDIPIEKLLNDYLKVMHSQFSDSVNKTFLLAHSGNLKMEQICTFMNEIGINDSKKKILKNTLMKSFHINIIGWDENDFNIKVSRDSKDLSHYLDELVDQRNSVAHGWVEDNRISLYDFNAYTIPYIKMLSEVLLRIILSESIQYKSQNDEELLFEPKPIHVYNNNIVCIHINGQAISKGDYLLYETQNKIICGKIECIQIDKQEQEQVFQKSCDVGIQIDTRINKDDKICMFI